jgi:hypothetical protein
MNDPILCILQRGWQNLNIASDEIDLEISDTNSDNAGIQASRPSNPTIHRSLIPYLHPVLFKLRAVEFPVTAVCLFQSEL